MRRAILAVVLAALAQACAHAGASSGGAVAKAVSAEEANVLAAEILSILEKEAPPGPTVALVIDKEAAADVLASVLAPRLVAAGYAVAAPGQPVREGAVRLRYSAAPMVGGVLLRLEVGEVLASRWYVRSAGGAGPLAAGSSVAIGRWP